MWKKLQTLYRNTGFLERDAIFIQLSTKTLKDFQGVAEFANTIKQDATQLKEIGVTDLLGGFTQLGCCMDYSPSITGLR